MEPLRGAFHGVWGEDGHLLGCGAADSAKVLLILWVVQTSRGLAGNDTGVMFLHPPTRAGCSAYTRDRLMVWVYSACPVLATKFKRGQVELRLNLAVLGRFLAFWADFLRFERAACVFVKVRMSVNLYFVYLQDEEGGTAVRG